MMIIYFSLIFSISWFFYLMYRTIKLKAQSHSGVMIALFLYIVLQILYFLVSIENVEFLLHYAWLILFVCMAIDYIFVDANRAVLIKTLRDFSSIHDKYHSIIENTPVAFYVIDQSGLIEFVNFYFTNLLGYTTPSELIGRNILDLTHPDYRMTAKEKIYLRVSGKIKVLKYTSKLQKKDGTYIAVEVNGARTENGHVTITGSISPIMED